MYRAVFVFLKGNTTKVYVDSFLSHIAAMISTSALLFPFSARRPIRAEFDQHKCSGADDGQQLIVSMQRSKR